MRIVFLGTGRFGVPALKALVRAGHDVLLAVSQPDRPSGRGRKTRPTPIRAVAEQLGIRHIQTEQVNAEQVRRLFGEAEIGVVAAFGQRIGGEILAGLPRGCVNIHASLLPKYRGAAPCQWAIISGEQTSGVTVFQLDERWDAGPILAQCETRIGQTETADELHDRLAGLGAELLVETLGALGRGEVAPRPQDASQATRAPKLTRADGVVDWTRPALEIVRRIHGLWSWPAASCLFCSRSGRRERVQLARARVVDERAGPSAAFPPGALLADLSVQAGAGRLRLLELKPQGGRLMSFEDFANGRQVRPPDRLSALEAP